MPALCFMIIPLIVFLYLGCFQPPDADDLLGPSKDDRALPVTR